MTIILSQVSGFVLDMMHTIDGGVLLNVLKQMFHVGYDDRSKYFMARLPPTIFRLLENALATWKYNSPNEFSRKPRPLADIKKWKMRETAMMGIYVIPALLHLPNVRQYLDNEMFDAYLNLVAGMRLVCGYSTRPVPPVSIVIFNFFPSLFLRLTTCPFCRQESLRTARNCFRRFLQFFVDNEDGDNDEFMTHLAHSLIHICDDAERFQCHLGVLCAYGFENFLMKFQQVQSYIV
jgi:hypothetical protein